nr:DUF4249 domain-containing protein [Hymenobacter guriensis]
MLAGCVEPYVPEVAPGEASLLVVDGYINSVGVSTIRLSRAVQLQTTKSAPVEAHAKVFIEEEGGAQYPLTESQPGTYTSAALTLPAGRPVRLHFTTAGQREYVSDYTSVKVTPPIDSLSWRTTADGLQVYVNTHDDSNLNRHYRWTFDETWEFTSMLKSVLEYRKGQITYRTDNIYNCWASESPGTIRMSNTTKLEKNIVSEQPIVLLPYRTPKLSIKYSVLVKQYALTPEEYAYWEALRKNTESIGSLYDPLPTQLTGNVHSVADPSEPVLGFIGAQSVIEKRLFIDRKQLPSDWPFVTGYETCTLDTIPRPHDPEPPSPQEVLNFFSTGAAIPIFEYQPNTNIFYYSTPECVDCRKRGTNVKPSFWP